MIKLQLETWKMNIKTFQALRIRRKTILFLLLSSKICVAYHLSYTNQEKEKTSSENGGVNLVYSFCLPSIIVTYVSMLFCNNSCKTSSYFLPPSFL